MKKKETYYLIGGGGMFAEQIKLCLTKKEVKKTLHEILEQLLTISNYLKKNKIRGYLYIPKKDKKQLFSKGISKELYSKCGLITEINFIISKWNGNYFVDATSKFTNTINELPKIKLYQVSKITI